MSLVLNETFLEGFVSQEEIASYAQRLTAAHRQLYAPDGQPKGWLALPTETPEA